MGEQEGRREERQWMECHDLETFLVSCDDEKQWVWELRVPCEASWAIWANPHTWERSAGEFVEDRIEEEIQVEGVCHHL